MNSSWPGGIAVGCYQNLQVSVRYPSCKKASDGPTGASSQVHPGGKRFMQGRDQMLKRFGPALLILGASITGIGCARVAGTQNSAASAPSITAQPTAQTVIEGQSATFSVAATGTAPLSYQWNKNGAAVSGATSSSYTTPATTSSDNGAQFAVVVSNAAGSVTSNSAILTVNAGPVAPSITTQPTSQTVTAGQAATFAVTATGTAPLRYQWNKNGAAISGATSSSYTTPATTSSDNGAQFAVVVSNAAGSVTSNTTPERLLTVARTFELAQKAHSLYLTRKHTKRGRLLKTLLLNCATDGVNLWPTYRKPFDLIFLRARNQKWSGRRDLNSGPPAPKAGALPGCATPRHEVRPYSKAVCDFAPSLSECESDTPT